MDAFYTAMAIALSSGCPSGYDKAWIEARMADGFSEQQYWCEGNGKKSNPDLTAQQTSVIDDALHEIRKQMTVPGQTPWSRCTFTLFPDGKFKFDVEYDD